MQRAKCLERLDQLIYLGLHLLGNLTEVQRVAAASGGPALVPEADGARRDRGAGGGAAEQPEARQQRVGLEERREGRADRRARDGLEEQVALDTQALISPHVLDTMSL